MREGRQAATRRSSPLEPWWMKYSNDPMAAGSHGNYGRNDLSCYTRNSGHPQLTT